MVFDGTPLQLERRAQQSAHIGCGIALHGQTGAPGGATVIRWTAATRGRAGGAATLPHVVGVGVSVAQPDQTTDEGADLPPFGWRQPLARQGVRLARAQLSLGHVLLVQVAGQLHEAEVREFEYGRETSQHSGGGAEHLSALQLEQVGRGDLRGLGDHLEGGAASLARFAKNFREGFEHASTLTIVNAPRNCTITACLPPVFTRPPR